MSRSAQSALLIPFLASLVLASGQAWAADPTDESENTPAAEPDQSFFFEARFGATVSGDADFDSDIGEFQVSHYLAGIKASRLVGSSSLLSFEFEAGLLDYDITPSATSVVGDAANIGAEFDEITTLSLIGLYADRTDEGHSWFIGGGVLSNAEQDADFGDSVDGLLTGGYSHRINSKLELGLGVAIRTRLDDDVLIVPIPQLKYTINEYWSIKSEGVGLRINYKASDDLDYGIVGKFESTTFRLDDSHALAPEGMATHSQFPLAFYADYSPNDTIQIKGSIGSMIGGELEILDTSGNDVAAQDIDMGVFGSLSISFSF